MGEDYLRSLHLTPHEDINAKFKRLTLEQAAAHYQNEYGVTLTVAEIVAGIDRRVESFYRQQVLAKPGVRDFLLRLRQNGVKMCVATATNLPLVKAALQRCGLYEFFSDIFTCADVGYGKDNPEIFNRALAALGTPQSQTVIFEDAHHAIRTAKNAGFTVCAVYDASEPHQAEIRAISDFYIRNYDEAMELLQ